MPPCWEEDVQVVRQNRPTKEKKKVAGQKYEWKFFNKMWHSKKKILVRQFRVSFLISFD